MTTNYEKYLAGEPLNEELAAMKAGRLPDTPAELLPVMAAPALEDAEKALSKDERIALRELRLSSGWPVLQKLLERGKIARKKSAMVLSEDDPFAQENANAWLHFKVWKLLVAELNWAVAIEIEPLEGHPHGRAETESPIQRA